MMTGGVIDMPYTDPRQADDLIECTDDKAEPCYFCGELVTDYLFDLGNERACCDDCNEPYNPHA